MHILSPGDLLQFGPYVSFRVSTMAPDQEPFIQQIYRSARHNPATGASNRKHLLQNLRSEVAYSLLHHTDTSVIRFRLEENAGELSNKLKESVIALVADVARDTVRTEDWLGRYTDDEFVGGLRGIELKGAARLAQRLHEAVQEAKVTELPKGARLSIRAGCASLHAKSDSGASGLVEAAAARISTI